MEGKYVRVSSLSESRRTVPQPTRCRIWQFSECWYYALSISCLDVSLCPDMFFRHAEQALSWCEKARSGMRNIPFGLVICAFRKRGNMQMRWEYCAESDWMTVKLEYLSYLSGMHATHFRESVCKIRFRQTSYFYFAKNFCQYFLLSILHGYTFVVSLYGLWRHVPWDAVCHVRYDDVRGRENVWGGMSLHAV